MSQKLYLNNLEIGYYFSLIEKFSAELNQGEVTLLIGKNGSGKSTLIKSIMQNIPLLKGNIKLNDILINKQNSYNYISVVFSKNNFNPDLTLLELLELGRFPFKRWYEKITQKEQNWIKKVIKITHLEKYKYFKVKELSDGNLQKASIARAMVQDTNFIILDEPTTHLDLENKLMILDLLKKFSIEFNKGILFTSHDLEYALKISNNLWTFKDNQFQAGFTEDLALKNKIFDQVENYQFNYKENQFNLINNKENIKKITLNIIDEKVYFWTKQALLKYNFIICNKSNIKITFLDNFFMIENYFKKIKSIQELIQELTTEKF